MGWWVPGETVLPGWIRNTQTTTVTMSSGRLLQAHFASRTDPSAPLHDLTITIAASGGSAEGVGQGTFGLVTTASSAGTYADGENVLLVATPNTLEGYVFMGWSGLPSGVRNIAQTTITMSEAHEVAANFASTASVTKPVEFLTLAVETDGADDDSVGGSVKGKGRGIGLEATPDERGAYFRGEVVDVTATAKTGYEFSRWSGGCTGKGQCAVTMNADKTVTAHFQEARPRLRTIVDEACGEIGAAIVPSSRSARADEFLPPGVQDQTFASGVTVRITARSTSTCTFTGLSEETDLTDECTTDADTYTCDVRMTEDREVTANFTRPDTYTLELSTSTLPASGPSCATVDATPVSDALFFYLEDDVDLEWSVEQGASVTVTATVADVRCTFVRWTGVESSAPSGGSGSARDSSATSCGGPSSCVVAMDDDRAVVAEFTYSDTAPAFAVETDSQTFQVGVEKSVQLPEATGGNGALTYGLDPIPAGLEFDTETAVLARKATTIGTMVAGTTTAELEVHDADDNIADSDADTVTVTIVVKPPDTAPMFAVDTYRAPFTVNMEGSVELPKASGGNGALSYTLSPKPAWLTLTVVGGVPTISGTPTTAGTTTAELKVHDADDNVADSDADTVAVTIKVGDEPQCSLDVVADPVAGGTVSGDWTGACGTERTARVTGVSDGYRFSGWSGGNCSGTNRECSDITVGTSGGPETTVTVTAHFMRQYTLTTTAGANGSIDPAPGTHTYNRGDSVSVRATPDRYYEVASWSGDCSGRATTCELTMDSDKTAGVTFQRITYVVTATAGANGSVSGGGTYNAGTTATLTASPNTGYEVDTWSGACSHSGTTCSFTVNGNKSAHVTFQRITYLVTATAGANGSVSGGGTYNAGTTATLTAGPNTGYEVDTWSGACSHSGTTCSFTVNGNKTAHVTFKKETYTFTVTASGGGSASAEAPTSTARAPRRRPPGTR